jgi:hypothetical protein
MRLIINFKRGQYSPVKDEFKALYTKVFKWNKFKEGWYGKTGFVKATEKMEPGMPVILNVECKDEIGQNIKSFCDDDSHKIDYIEVQDFSLAGTPQLLPVEIIESEHVLPKEEKKIVPYVPWMCPEHKYDYWQYRKEQLLNSWYPNFKVVWQ